MDTLIEYYSKRILDFNKQIESQKSKTNVIFYSRLILFIVALILFFDLIGTNNTIATSIALITIVIFLILLRLEINISRKITFLQNLIKANELELNILNEKYDMLNEGSEFMDKHHNFISDLDIFGRKSLFQILNRTSTYSGRIKLSRWLTYPFIDPELIAQKQEAIKDLALQPEWCQQFIASGITNKEGASDKDVIQEWLEETNNFSSSFLKVISIVLPAFTLLALGLYLFNITGSTVFTYLFFIQLFIILSKTKKVNEEHNKLSRKFDSIEKYRTLISLIELQTFNASILKDLKASFQNKETSAGNDIKKLKKLVDALDARMNIVVSILLNGVLLWDINVMRKIEKWRSDHKTNFIKWIDVIGEFDAYISLSLYSFNNSNYAFPEVSKDTFIMDAENIGHPLISKNKLVKNNYHIKGTPKIDLLTGANMAGKSTFLRTIGVNLNLAMIGAPVCASKFKFTPIVLFTSLRTNDSLQENESFFYAELKRLQLLIQHYKSGERVFFLLDEILKGTNSKDQHAGSEALIKKIIQLNGVGIVATHDVELSNLSSMYTDNVRNLCFEITINDDKLNFDYKIKEGVCSTMNASFLMKKMEITD